MKRNISELDFCKEVAAHRGRFALHSGLKMAGQGVSPSRLFTAKSRTMKKPGFTLIEVIVSIVITAILATLLVTMMGSALTRSADPVLVLRNAYDLQKVIENMTAGTNGLSVRKTSIGAEGGSYSNSYGAYQVVNNRYIQFSGNAEVSGGTNILKVTIKNAGGDTLTRLLFQ